MERGILKRWFQFREKKGGCMKGWEGLVREITQCTAEERQDEGLNPGQSWGGAGGERTDPVMTP